MTKRHNTIAGLLAKRDQLTKLRGQLEADIRALSLDIDHSEAAIRIFDPEDTVPEDVCKPVGPPCYMMPCRKCLAVGPFLDDEGPCIRASISCV